MRGRFGALPLLLSFAVGCQLQVALNPIGSPKPDTVITPSQQVPVPPVVKPNAVIAEVHPRPRWRATDPEDQIARPVTPQSNVVRSDVSPAPLHLPTTGLTADAFSQTAAKESVRRASARMLPPAPAAEPELLQSAGQAQSISISDSNAVVTFVAAVPTVAPTDDEPALQALADRFPVNLATVLQLAGAENWRVRLAVERVHEAQAT
jgi:hypothetical protein